MSKDRNYLPIPPATFEGRIGTTYKESEAVVPELDGPPDGAPNVVLIMLDDVGFGQTSMFGGPAQTPHIEQLAAEGVTYNRFHTTALCSPTRAALLSGRNHHSVHTGTIMELATGFPGYDGVWPADAASVAEILKANGYNTAAFGKWHNTPDYESSPAGPFTQWPTGKGFEYFYGFMGGEADQWNTPLYENTNPIEQPADDPDWHFSEAIAEQAIGWMARQKASAPDKPFFLYWAPGAAHAPHHVTDEWSDKYKGKFDHGWDKQREITFENQKQKGVIPQETQLTPRPDSIPSWDSRSDDEKKLYARMQEVFAGFLEHVDTQAGKVIEALDALGIRDNTLVIYIVGDNGPSAEGTLTGTLNNMKTQQGYHDSIDFMLKHIDEIGGPMHENHYPVPWCWAGSSPFQWMKQVASHFGGTRNGLIIRWPDKIKDKGSLRSQFHHVIDITPTILEAAGIPQPFEVNGSPQRPMEGVSLAYTWDDAEAKGRHITQYFEMFGNRALYHDGWVAGCQHGKLPWQMSGSKSFDDDTWELYNIEEDFSQANDLAKDHPEKLRELQDMFMQEAARYNVFPLDDRFAERVDVSLRPNYVQGIKNFVYLPETARIPEASSPNTKNINHVLAAQIEIPEEGAEGVLLCCGGRTSGYTLYVQDGKLHWEHNWFGQDRYRVSSDDKLPAGRQVVSATIECDEEGKVGGGGNVTLRTGETEIGSGRFDKQVPFRFTVNETFDVGCDLVTPVSDKYESPYRFTGTLYQAMVDISDRTFEELAFSAKAKDAINEVKARIAMALQ
ncbi:MAG: arylsulfatase [Caldilineaceae bacterium]|nr:arylsulfatase [Caldilineaceae bacterium]